jgi:hypothetical protein
MARVIHLFLVFVVVVALVELANRAQFGDGLALIIGFSVVVLWVGTLRDDPAEKIVYKERAMYNLALSRVTDFVKENLPPHILQRMKDKDPELFVELDLSVPESRPAEVNVSGWATPSTFPDPYIDPVKTEDLSVTPHPLKFETLGPRVDSESTAGAEPIQLSGLVAVCEPCAHPWRGSLPGFTVVQSGEHTALKCPTFSSYNPNFSEEDSNSPESYLHVSNYRLSREQVSSFMQYLSCWYDTGRLIYRPKENVDVTSLDMGTGD